MDPLKLKIVAQNLQNCPYFSRFHWEVLYHHFYQGYLTMYKQVVYPDMDIYFSAWLFTGSYRSIVLLLSWCIFNFFMSQPCPKRK